MNQYKQEISLIVFLGDRRIKLNTPTPVNHGLERKRQRQEISHAV